MKEKLFQKINPKLDNAMHFLLENQEVQSMESLCNKSDEISSGYSISALITDNLRDKSLLVQKYIRDILEIVTGVDDDIVEYMQDVTENMEKDAISQLEKSGMAPYRIDYLKKSSDGIASKDKLQFRHNFPKEIRDYSLARIRDYLKTKRDEKNIQEEVAEVKEEDRASGKRAKSESVQFGSEKVETPTTVSAYRSKSDQENSDRQVAVSITIEEQLKKLERENAILREVVSRELGQAKLNEVLTTMNRCSSPSSTPSIPLSAQRAAEKNSMTTKTVR